MAAHGRAGGPGGVAARRRRLAVAERQALGHPRADRHDVAHRPAVELLGEIEQAAALGQDRAARARRRRRSRRATPSWPTAPRRRPRGSRRRAAARPSAAAAPRRRAGRTARARPRRLEQLEVLGVVERERGAAGDGDAHGPAAGSGRSAAGGLQRSPGELGRRARQREQAAQVAVLRRRRGRGARWRRGRAPRARRRGRARGGARASRRSASRGSAPSTGTPSGSSASRSSVACHGLPTRLRITPATSTSGSNVA